MKETRDILSLFEALNSHEVFTPPRVARDVISLLPTELWSNPHLKVLDPCAKSGVFLREIFFRLVDGLSEYGVFTAGDGITYDLNNRQELINHILKNMLFGIATSELTGYVTRRTLYGVMEANTDKQIAAIECFEKSENNKSWTEQERLDFIGRNKFNEYYDHRLFTNRFYRGHEAEGNIFYPIYEVRKKVLEDGSYAVEDAYYPFIENSTKHRLINNIKAREMEFDVIIGNPPYQVRDGGAGASAKPIYHLFVEQALALKPKYVSFIIPSRWFAGGKGLDSFREKMLSNDKIRTIVDFPNAKDCFPGTSIGGGVCYFLIDSSYSGDCEIVNVTNGSRDSVFRKLDQYPVFVRHNKALSIIEKANADSVGNLSSIVSSRNSFGFDSTTRGSTNESAHSLKLHSSAGEFFVLKADLEKSKDLCESFKVMTSKVISEHAGEPDKSGQFKVLARTAVLGPNEVCTDSYLCVGKLETLDEARNLLSYLSTKLARFLLLQAVTSINLSAEKFVFVPLQNWGEHWTDAKLYERYNLTASEIAFIESLIKPMNI